MKFSPDANPFEYARPVPAEDVIDRDEDTERLLALADGGHNVRIAAPRRYGKTSLMSKVFAHAERDASMVPILVDLYRVESLADIAIRIERAYASQLKGRIRDRVAKLFEQAAVGLSLGPVGLNVNLVDRAPDRALPLIHTLMDLPRTVLTDTGKRALIVFDEFQDVADVASAEGLLRSHIQHQRDVASYVYMGSEPSMLRAMFEDRRRALFEQAVPYALGRLAGPDIAAYVADRFAQTERDAGEQLGRLVAVVAGHPQRAMLLAHCLWAQVPRHGRAEHEHWVAALGTAELQVEQQFDAVWQQLHPVERKVLRALAAGSSPAGPAAATEYGYSRSSATNALRRLVDRGDLARTGGAGPWAFVDPFFERWVARAAVGDSYVPNG